MTKPKTTITGTQALEMRLRRDMNQTQFWSRIGVTQSGASRYEHGRNIPHPVQKLLLIAYGTPAQRQHALDELNPQGN